MQRANNNAHAIVDIGGRDGTEGGAIAKRTAQKKGEKEDAGCRNGNDDSKRVLGQG